MVISIDGVVVPEDRATISVLDRGFLYGDGLFEVLRTWNLVAVDLDAHLDRMAAAAAALKLGFDRATVTTAVRTTIAAAGDDADYRIRIIVTRGRGGVAVRFAAVRGGHTIVILEPLGTLPMTTTAAFVAWDVPARATGYKTLAYLDSLIAKELAAERGAEEALRLGPGGRVVEGATSNLFIVKAEIVQTPPLATGILPGITREHVLACCQQLQIAAVECGLTAHHVESADEIFVTSSVRGVVAVTHLEGHRVGAGVGPVTQKLVTAYAERMSRATIPV
ncbi:MAG: aminotransferase class IV [Kofleriaceae bacterium]